MPNWLLPILLIVACTGPAPEPSLEYTVQRGDSLSKIAQSHGVAVGDLRTWNDLRGDLIHPGDVLIIRAAVTTALPPAKSRTRRSRRQQLEQEAKGLSLPPLKSCLKGPDLNSLVADEGFVSSRGLTLDQLRTTMTPFIPNTLACASLDPQPPGKLTVEITVACTGRVASVRIMDAGPYRDPFVSCVRDTLKFAAFPAHELPDGFVFDYPLHFSF